MKIFITLWVLFAALVVAACFKVSSDCSRQEEEEERERRKDDK